MKVTLIEHNPNALELLIATKGTRLNGEGYDEILKWDNKRKLDELSYIKDTIKSSWEFVTYTFLIEDVSRVFTHQLVRTRTQSYAQEAQRAVDLSDRLPLNLGRWEEYDDAFYTSITAYQEMIQNGVTLQDARGVLPADMLTSIYVKTNLRTLHDTALLRLCKRTQGEYQNVFKEIKKAIVEVHPWAESFINVACVQTGICAFPRYTECPVQEHTVKISQDYKNVIKHFWEQINHEANPVAKNGRAQ